MIHQALEKFDDFGKRTKSFSLAVPGAGKIPVYVNEFWTAKQRAAHSLHEISYRACFKPQLPGFFIELLTKPGDIVYDPFAGRGTTLIEAALLDRVPYGCDINPLSEMLVSPRLEPPAIDQVEKRLSELRLRAPKTLPDELRVFYHRETLRMLCALKNYFLRREGAGKLDNIDRWIRMVAINRLSGHSPGFFSVYTMPPNQAVSVDSQRKINRRLNQRPGAKDVFALILRKTRMLCRDTAPVRKAKRKKFLTGSAEATPQIRSGSVRLVVTSPPFLDVVDYVNDNWLRGWFAGIDLSRVPVWQLRKLEDWSGRMEQVFSELRRVLVPGGAVAFEVGEVRNGKLNLEEAAAEAGVRAGLHPELVLINEQKFTKTSNCWGIDNLKRGTNSNRVVLFRK